MFVDKRINWKQGRSTEVIFFFNIRNSPNKVSMEKIARKTEKMKVVSFDNIFLRTMKYACIC